MKKQLLKQFVQVSYKKNELDKQTVEKIASFLSRKELKEYIRALRAYERSIQVTITSVQDLTKHEKALQSIFPEKKLIFKTDASLLAGMQVVYNDSVYELSLKNTLKQLEDHING